MRRPNLFIVGAPKCGTTALHFYLSQHPDVCMSEPKEPNYFGSLVEPFPKSDEQYLEYCFSHWQDEPVAGEATPWYLACPHAASRIYQFNPKAKIVIMLRNPVDMMHSLHSEFFFAGSEQEDDFVKALDLEERRLNGEMIKTTSKPPYKLAYRKMANYVEQVRRYLSVFPPEQVLIILQEDMHADTAVVYRQVLEFIGVDSTFCPELPRINANKETRSKMLRKLLMHPPAWLRKAGRMLINNDSIQHAMRHKMRMLNQRINAKKTRRKEIPIELRSRLLAEIRPEIRELSGVINRDLSHWLAGARSNSK